MSTLNRRTLVCLTATVVVAFAVCDSSLAQRRGNFGFSQGGSSNQNNSNNDDENQNNQNSNRRRNNQASQSGDANLQQFQQFFQQGQGGQNNQGGPNQNRRQGQQGQFQGQQFPFNQQGGNFQQQQLQHWQQQVGQGNWHQGNAQFGNWQSRKWEGTRHISKWTQQFAEGPQPFTKNWYQAHPKAWHHHQHHGHWENDVWVVATTAGISAWLGWGNYPQGTTVVYGYYPSDGDHVQIVDPSGFGEWYPLGVYSLLTGPFDSGTRMVQLAIDRQGNIAGTYYDVITDTSHIVSGRVSRNSQRASWSLKSNKWLTFRAPISQLTQPQGVVTVRLPGGEQQWQIVRLENYGN